MRFDVFRAIMPMSRLLLALPLLAASGLAAAAGSAVAVSPLHVSVVAGETQVFSARFLDAAGQPAAGQLVSFFNDACGTFSGSNAFTDRVVTDSAGVASTTFTALRTGSIRCTVSATAANGASLNYDVLTYPLSNAYLVATLTPPQPRPGQPYSVAVSAKVGVYELYNVDIAAAVTAGSASASVSATPQNSGQTGIVQFNVMPDGRLGDYSLGFDYRGRKLSVPVAAPANPWQDVWWSGDAENGWGMSVVQHRDLLFSIIYAYDDAGKAVWYVMPSGSWNDAHTAFTGDVYVPRGSPYYNYDASRFDIGASLGRATITFAGANAASLDYTLRGVSGHKSLGRIFFGQGSPGTVADAGDMWWGGTAQNGWGFSVLQQGRDIFTLWFTYDETGAATWFVVPAGGWSEARTFLGSLYRSSGSPWLGKTYDPSQFRMDNLGWAAMRFNEDGSAMFSYSLAGGPVSTLPLSRIPF